MVLLGWECTVAAAAYLDDERTHEAARPLCLTITLPVVGDHLRQSTPNRPLRAQVVPARGGDEERRTALRNGSGTRQDSVRRYSTLKCLAKLATDDDRWDVRGIADVMNSKPSCNSYLINTIQSIKFYDR